MDERTPIARARAGDREALGKLLVENQRVCYAVALRLADSVEDAEDVCQDAFVRASRDVATYRGEGSFRSWLLGLVAHAHADRVDSEKSRRRREEEHAMEREAVTAGMAGDDSGGDLRQRLDAALGRLEKRYRLPIVLHYEQGLSYDEVAAALSLPEGTVATNIRRGLDELRGMLSRAGCAAAAPAVVAALAQAPSVAVPASLTAFIGNLTAGSVGKAAAGAAIKVSSRLAAKKAVGLALGWKVAAVAGAVALGTAAFVTLGKPPSAPAPAAVAPATLGAPGIIFEFKGGRVDDPFWEVEKNVRMGGGFFPGCLVLSPPSAGPSSGEPSELISREVRLEGRPVEMRFEFGGNQLPAGALKNPVSPLAWRQSVAIESRNGPDWQAAAFLAWSNATPPSSELALGTERHPVAWVGHLGATEARFLVSPSGDLACTLSFPTKRSQVFLGRAGGAVGSARLRITAENTWWGYRRIAVRRLAKWPDDVPLPGSSARGGQP